MSFHALIVDDDVSICEVLRDLADSLTHTCDIAHDVQSARGHIGNKKYDYIILDLSIPMNFSRLPDVLHGLEFIREIQISATNGMTPIFAISGISTRQEAFETRDLGAISFIDKPLNIRELAQEIKRHVHTAGHEEISADSNDNCSTTESKFSDEEREIILDSNGIRICGVEVYKFGYNPKIKYIIQRLNTRQDGGYIHLHAKDMASIGTENDISKTVTVFRKRASKLLREYRNIDCDTFDIIGKGGGYFLRENVRVRFTDGGSVE
jgi:DNA-binding response OmpR family regulator